MAGLANAGTTGSGGEMSPVINPAEPKDIVGFVLKPRRVR